jgi:hypothetical protein
MFSRRRTKWVSFTLKCDISCHAVLHLTIYIMQRTLLDSMDAILSNGIKINIYDNIKPATTRMIPLCQG